MQRIAQRATRPSHGESGSPTLPRQDLVGKRFGRLIVVSFAGRKATNARWNVQCDCGVEKVVYAHSLIGGRTQSCGCLRHEVNSRNPALLRKSDELYPIWRGMIARCTNKNNSAWHRYGGRGITVCAEWLDFEAFRRDMAPRPPGLQLDRTDNNAGYSRENCRWVTPKENCRNRRDNVVIECQGRMVTVTEAAGLTGLPRLALYRRARSKNPDLFRPVETIKGAANTLAAIAARRSGGAA